MMRQDNRTVQVEMPDGTWRTTVPGVRWIVHNGELLEIFLRFFTGRIAKRTEAAIEMEKTNEDYRQRYK